jgi:hypothetical protein
MARRAACCLSIREEVDVVESDKAAVSRLPEGQQKEIIDEALAYCAARGVLVDTGRKRWSARTQSYDPIYRKA